MTFELHDVVPWGRSYDEYLSMFALTEADLSRRILGCADGPASFNAVLTEKGGQVVSCDPIYQFAPAELRSRIGEAASAIAAELRENPDEFVWNHFASVEDVVETRLSAMGEFLKDLRSGLIDGRYVNASLPQLPFADGEFELALCSHFLFLYSEQHDSDFHTRSLLELCRVAAEVRVFPLLELGSVLSRHLSAVNAALAARHIRVEVVAVPYEFQNGGNEMLVIKPSIR